MNDEPSGTNVLCAAGRLDAATSPALDLRVDRALEGGARYMVLDFSNLDYLSSAGLRLILRAAQRLRARGGKLAIAAPRSEVLQILKTAGFPGLIPVGGTVAEAERQALSGGVPHGEPAASLSGLNLPEELLLLAFDGREGRVRSVEGFAVSNVLAACAVIELALLGRLEWDLKELRVASSRPTGDAILDTVFAAFSELGAQPIETGLRAVFKRSSQIQSRVLSELVRKGILKEETRKVMGLFETRRHSWAESSPLAALRARMRAIVLSDELPFPREAVLAGLANTCGLLDTILSRDEIESRRARLSQLWQLDLVGQTLSRLIHEIERLARLAAMM